ncbi:MAG: histidinol-phosphate transaminase [bacterium]
MDFFKLAKPQIREIRPYQPGKLFEGRGDVLKLASNENLLGISQQIRDAIIAELDYVHYYPDDDALRVRTALADKYGCSPDNLIMGNGAVQIIYYLAEAFLLPGDEMIMAWPGFSIFDIYAQAQGATRIRVPVDLNFKADLGKILSEVTDRTKLICIDNPNNPCGTYVSERELRDFLSKLPPRVLVLLDEAYYDFTDAPDYPEATLIWREFPNVVVARTFAKVYALAGLRAGVGIGHEGMMQVLWRVKGPFNLNRLAGAALLAALGDEEFYKTTTENVKRMRKYIDAKLTEAGIFHPPSQANFFLLDSGVDGKKLNELMNEDGVYLRPMAGFGLPTYFRASFPPTEEQAERFIETLVRNIGSVRGF